MLQRDAVPNSLGKAGEANSSVEEAGVSGMEGVSRSGSKGWRLRGVQWRVKLGLLPRSPAPIDDLRRSAADTRRRYADLRRRLLVDPHLMDDALKTPQLNMDNPLSLDPESIWGRYFRNAELERTIDKDLSRLYPEHGTFFQSVPCQAMMRRILLVWSLIHPHISYRQGMHELLAPLLYVLHVDVVCLSQVKRRFEELFDDRFDDVSRQVEPMRGRMEAARKSSGKLVLVGESGIVEDEDEGQHTPESSSEPDEQNADLDVIVQGSDMYGVEGELGALLSTRFVEHDAYCMFDALLIGEGGAVAMAEFFAPPNGVLVPPVIEASASLYRTLAAADIALYTHLLELGVEPQFFALRWLRLLFGREFCLDDLLCVWDSIFGADNTAALSTLEQDYGCGLKVSARSALISALAVSMLLYVRPALLAAPDSTGCLQRLLNFPQIPDVKDLIDSAKLIQPLAQAAARSPLPTISKTRSVYDINRNSKHSRSGSISPPNNHHHVLRHQRSTPCSPDVLRMSLPESYWEERWTHSVLHRKGPDDLFSPRCRAESVSRAFENIETSGDAFLTARMSGGISSDGSCQEERSDYSAFLQRSKTGDPSLDSSEEIGQELLNRSGELALESVEVLSHHHKLSDASALKPELGMEDAFTIGGDFAGGQSQKLLDDSVQHGVPPALADDGLGNRGRPRSTLESQVGELLRSCLEETQREVDIACVDVATACLKEQADGEVLIIGDDDLRKEITVIALQASSKRTDTTGGLDNCSFPGTCEEALASVDTGAVSIGSEGEAEDIGNEQTVTAELEVSCSSSTADFDTAPQLTLPYIQATFEHKFAAHTNNQGYTEEITCLIEDCKIPNLSTSNKDFGDGSASLAVLTDNPNLDLVVLEDSSKVEESSNLSTPKPVCSANTRGGRLNWVWSLGKVTFFEKTVNAKVLKDESCSSFAYPSGSGNNVVSDTDTVPGSLSANSMRKPKRWWRSNNDIVPEDCVVSVSSLANSSGDIVVPEVDVEKGSTHPPVVSSTSEPKKELAVETVGGSQEISKKPKELITSAALHALGQSMLDHIQVLESALAQRAPVLGMESLMWTPAVRERNDSFHKTRLGGKGQVAALAAIAELRKISNALQQM